MSTQRPLLLDRQGGPRAAVAAVEGELARLANASDLLGAWLALPQVLELEPAPAPRGRPSFGNTRTHGASRRRSCCTNLDALAVAAP